MTPALPTEQMQLMRPRIAIFAFGALQVIRDGVTVAEVAWHTRQARQLLKILITERPRPVAADRLIDSLWPHSPPAAAATTLRSAVNALRNVLEPGRPKRAPSKYIMTQAPGYAFLLHPDIWLDVETFEKELESSRRTSQAAARAQHLQTAVDLYLDDYLAGDPYADWVTNERERLQELYINAQLELAALRADAEDFSAAIAACRQVLTRDPVRETAYQALMRYQATTGDSAGALLSYERCRGLLTEELGADPSPLTQQIHQQILNGEIKPVTDARARPQAKPRSGDATTHVLPQRTLLPVPDAPIFDHFVGREQEIAVLRAALENALQHRGNLVVLEGEAGVGKTRLGALLLEEAAGAGATVVSGACRLLERQLPFAPLADMIGRFILSLPTAALTSLPVASLTPIVQMVPSLQDRLPDLTPSLREGMLRAEENRQRIVEGMVSLLVGMASLRPLVIFLDDLHWADRDTLAVLGRLAQRCGDRPLLLLLAYRTDDLADNDELTLLLHDLRRHRQTTVLPVNRLAATQVQRLVRLYVSDARPTEALSAALYQITQGNPLFVTEALRDFRERHAASTPLASAATDAPAIHFNGRVHEVILERIERLPTAAQDLLHLAAAFSRDFSLDLLEATAERDPLEPLQVLMQRRFLVDRSDDRLDFSHAVVRQVAYERINILQRRRLHRRIADALAARADAEQLARELAYHLRQAGLSNRLPFARFSVMAGEQLLHSFGFRQAVEHLDAALATLLALNDAPPDLIRRAYQGLGLAYEGLVDPDGVTQTYRRLHAWATAQGDRTLMLTTHSRFTSVLTLLGRQAESNELLAELYAGLRHGQDADAGSQVIRDLIARRHLIYSQDTPEESTAWTPYTPAPPAVPDPETDLLRQLEPVYAVLPLFDYGATLLSQGQIRAATRCLEGVIELATQTAQPSIAANAYHQLAMTARVMGDPEQSRRLAEQSLALSRQAPDAGGEAANWWPQITGAFLDIHRGRINEAEITLQGIVAQLETRPAFHNYRQAAQIGLAAVAVARGQFTAAASLLEPAVADPGNRFPFTHVRGLLLLARIAAAQGHMDRSAVYLRRALDFAGRRSLLDEYVQAVLALMDLRLPGAPVAELVGSVLATIRTLDLPAAEQRLRSALAHYLADTDSTA